MNFWSGNQAIVEGALAVGAKFYAGYPITPASEIMELWSEKAANDQDLNFLQSEDELAAIHHVIGAAISGVPAFTATSGPGLSLMQEGLGLAFTYQAPAVVVDVMRSGPSTGKPTRAGQGEILASKYGSHGDVCPFVFYPTSVQECYSYTIKAFQVAWEYNVPVILLSDAYLAHMREQLKVKSEKLEINHQSSTINHYSGLIDRESNAERIKELTAVGQKNYRDYKLWGNDDADTLLIGLGSMARALRAFEDEYQIFAPVRVWPFLKKEILAAGEGKENIVVVEMNEGQYVKEVERVLARKVEFVSYRDETISVEKLKKLIG
jgi:2-oxoglutarate ferredoxin oxidoreductase subunit alpha